LPRPIIINLEQAALYGPVISGVRLDARDDADVVGLRGVAVEHHGVALGGGAGLDHLHRGADRGADELLGDAVAFEDLPLAGRRAAAVTAHGGDEEGLRAESSQKRRRRTQDQGDVGDATASGGQGDAVAGPDALAQVELLQGAGDGGGDVVDARALEVLTDADQKRIGHGRNSP
jgi:hypothetical protein